MVGRRQERWRGDEQKDLGVCGKDLGWEMRL